MRWSVKFAFFVLFLCISVQLRSFYSARKLNLAFLIPSDETEYHQFSINLWREPAVASPPYIDDHRTLWAAGWNARDPK
jgi:hypothetical protein